MKKFGMYLHRDLGIYGSERWMVLEVEPGTALTVEFTRSSTFVGKSWGTFHGEHWHLLGAPEEWVEC